MKHAKGIGVCLSAVLAVAGIGANTALASSKPKPPKPGLVLSYEGVPAPVGETALGGIEVDECHVITEGTLTKNKSTSDEAAFSKNRGEPFCEEPGYAISGEVTSAKLTMAGDMSFKSAITLTVPGSCSYAIKKFEVPFDPNAIEATFGGSSVTAKLAPKQSKACVKTLTVPIEAGLLDESSGPYTTETT